MDLAAVRRDAEAFSIALARENYLLASGQKLEPERVAIYQRWAHLFTRTRVDALRRRLDQATADADRDVYRRFLAFLVRGFLEAEVRHPAEELERVRLQLPVDIGGRPTPFPHAQVLLAGEPDRARRQEMQQALDEAKRRHLNPLAAQVLVETHRLVQQLGYRDYVTLWDELKELDLDRLQQLCGAFLDETRDAAHTALSRDLTEHLGLSLEEAEVHDYAFLNRGLGFDRYFAPDRLLGALHTTLSGLGLDLAAGGRVRLDLEPRERKSPRAFCAIIRVPDEVVLVIMPQGGLRDYSGLFHEAGHALHFGHVHPEVPFEWGRLGDISVSETYAFLFQHLLMQPGWLHEVLGVPLPVVADLVAFQRRVELLLVRRYCAKLRYELQLHRASDPTTQADTYARELRAATFLPYPHVDFITDVDPAFYSAQYLRAWMAAAQLRSVLKQRWGVAWWSYRAAGDFLRELWSWGQRYDVTDLLRLQGYDGLEATRLVEEFVGTGR